MNKAFTAEQDGWYYCREQFEFCAYADEFGRCRLEECVLEDDWDLDAEEEEP